MIFLEFKIHIKLKRMMIAFKLRVGVIKCTKVEGSFTGQKVVIIILFIIL